MDITHSKHVCQGSSFIVVPPIPPIPCYSKTVVLKSEYYGLILMKGDE